MNNLTPASSIPVVRDNFHFSGTVLAIIADNGAVHSRRTLAELGRHYHDIVSHGAAAVESFSEADYQAQLIHYGLPPAKGGQKAKWTLMEAVVGLEPLVVPEKLLGLEREMKEGWRALKSRRRETGAHDGQSVLGVAAGELRRLARGLRGVSAMSLRGNQGVSGHPGLAAARRVAPVSSFIGNGFNFNTTQTRGGQSTSSHSISQRSTLSSRFAVLDNPLGSITNIFRSLGSPFRTPPPDPETTKPPLVNEAPAPAYVCASLPGLGSVEGRYAIPSLTSSTGSADPTLGRFPKTMVCTVDKEALWVLFDLGFAYGSMAVTQWPRISAWVPVQATWCGKNRVLERRCHLVREGGLLFIGNGCVDVMIECDGQRWEFMAVRIGGPADVPENLDWLARGKNQWQILPQAFMSDVD
ncbi:hypothetical protein CORC01_09446 [Colletotrichum orchidophilum]|uniref:Uncharacterized protein n=1 Tax=Colletotrichum orchidophilum TaxID=1209926 RepID=A0A1G4B1N7_9PEZI|nr:uncharacterized protein CORC01_09446 [Colletotrichum orchidophilum]OHE95301.1 hypothetical protein CORC01_09446 [Colletotrichum orchidophilum]